MGRCASNQLCGKACFWLKVEMTMLLLVMVPMQVLLLSLPQRRAQTLKFWVLDIPCNPQEQNKIDRARNPYCPTGCSMQMVCQYENHTEDFCSMRNATNLRVDPPKPELENRITILNSTKCSLTVQFENMTADFHGRYNCLDDLNSGIFIPRIIHVGEQPVAPTDVRPMFEPQGNISLLLNPVKTGKDLGNEKTKWIVRYKWNESEGYKRCQKGRLSDKRCERLRPDGLCQPCFIKLRRYDGWGQYSSQGFIGNQIHFNVSVKNLFGEVFAQHTFYLLNWVKPGPVNSIRLKYRGPSWLTVSVTAPKHFDWAHFNTIPNKNNALAVNYTVELLSPKEQSLLHDDSRQFNQMYGFVRNLEEDEAALREILASDFRHFSEVLGWNVSEQWKSEIAPQALNITGLPFPGHFYKVTVTTRAHYLGKAHSLLLQTNENAPEEGPKLHDNFAYCRLPPGKDCTFCVIYFKEIPRSRRGGVVQNYTLTVTRLNGGKLPACNSCRNRDKFVVGGQNNTFLVKNLTAGVYSVGVQANSRRGPSPTTWRMLHVHSASPLTAPSNVIVESSGTTYYLSWRPGHGIVDTFVHRCYTIPLQLQQPVDANSSLFSEAAAPLNCVTNMVALILQKNRTASFIFDEVHSYNDLTPAFFVSTVMPGDHTQNSGLVGVECYYTSGYVPERVDAKTISVRPLENDPSALEVKFGLPCGKNLNYGNGRPERYSIGVQRHDGPCKEICRDIKETHTSVIQDSLKDGITYILRHLTPESRFCLYVNLAAARDGFDHSKRQCVEGRTGKVAEKPFYIKVTLIPVSLLFAVVLIGVCVQRYKGSSKKFGISLHVVPSPPEAVERLLESGRQNEGQNNPMFIWDKGFPSSASCRSPGSVKHPGEPLLKDAKRWPAPTSGPGAAASSVPGSSNTPNHSITSRRSGLAAEEGGDKEDYSDDSQDGTAGSDCGGCSKVMRSGWGEGGLQSDCWANRPPASFSSQCPSAGQTPRYPAYRFSDADHLPTSFNSRYPSARQQPCNYTHSSEEEEEETEEMEEEESQCGEDSEEELVEDGENNEETESSSASAATEEGVVTSQSMLSDSDHSSSTSSIENNLLAAGCATDCLCPVPAQPAPELKDFSPFAVHPLVGRPSIDEILQAAKDFAPSSPDGSVIDGVLKASMSIGIGARLDHAEVQGTPSSAGGGSAAALLAAPASLETAGIENLDDVEDILLAAKNCPTPSATCATTAGGGDGIAGSDVEDILLAAKNCPTLSATGATTAGGGDGVAGSSGAHIQQQTLAKNPVMLDTSQRQRHRLPELSQAANSCANSLCESKKELMSSLDIILRAAEGCPWQCAVQSESNPGSTLKRAESFSGSDSSSDRDSVCVSTSSAESGFRSDSTKETDAEPDPSAKCRVPSTASSSECDGEVVIRDALGRKTESNTAGSVHSGDEPKMTQAQAHVLQDQQEPCNMNCDLNSVTRVKTAPVGQQQASDRVPLLVRSVSDIQKLDFSDDSMLVSECTTFLPKDKDRSKERKRSKVLGPHKHSTYYKVTREEGNGESRV